MNSDSRAHLQQLLHGQRVLSLAVLVSGEPQLGLVPFVLLPDNTGVLVHVSSLAKHAQGMMSGVRVALLIHQSEEAVGNPLQVPRVSWRGEVRELPRGEKAYEEGKALYLARFPEAAVTFGLADFRLFELKFIDGRYIEGFARAIDVTPEDIREIGAQEPAREAKEETRTNRFRKIARD